MNFMDARIVSEGGKVFVDAGAIKLPLPEGHPAGAMVGKSVSLGIRPENIYDAGMNNPIPTTAENTIEAHVDVLEPLGHQYIVYLKAGGHTFQESIDAGTKLKIDDHAKFVVNLDLLHIFDAETEVAIR